MWRENKGKVISTYIDIYIYKSRMESTTTHLTWTEAESKLCLKVTGIAVEVFIRNHHHHPPTPAHTRSHALWSASWLWVGSLETDFFLSSKLLYLHLNGYIISQDQFSTTHETFWSPFFLNITFVFFSTQIVEIVHITHESCTGPFLRMTPQSFTWSCESCG